MTEEEKKYGFRDQHELPYISDEDDQKNLEELRKMSPFEVKWDLYIPKNCMHQEMNESNRPKYTDAILAEHAKVVLAIRMYHLENGYDAAEKIANFYCDEWMGNHAPNFLADTHHCRLAMELQNGNGIITRQNGIQGNGWTRNGRRCSR